MSKDDVLATLSSIIAPTMMRDFPAQFEMLLVRHVAANACGAMNTSTISSAHIDAMRQIAVCTVKRLMDTYVLTCCVPLLSDFVDDRGAREGNE